MKEINKKRKFNRGITLIALVITIIVLLILAGVSLSLLVGENGILNRATTSASRTNQAQIQEEIGLAYNAIMVDSLREGWDNSQKAKALEKELQEEDPKTAVIPLEEMLLVSYKGYEATIDSHGQISIEDISKGEKPSAEVTILTTGEGVEKVEIQVIAKVSDATIEAIEALNGAVLKTENSKENQIFEVSENGKFYFRIKASNGRTAIIASEEVTNILQFSESLLEGISKMNTSGLKKVKVSGKTVDGKTEDVTYSLNVIHHQGDVILDGTTSVGEDRLYDYNGIKIYEFGSQDDVAKSNSYAQNTVVLKVEGDLTINENVALFPVLSSEGYGGPKGMIVYCTGTVTNNGIISMTGRGAKAEGENVYLWKNGDGSFEYVPAVGADGGEGIDANGTFCGLKGENGNERMTAGGGSGATNHPHKNTEGSGSGGSGTSYSGGAGGGSEHTSGIPATDGSSYGGAGGMAHAGNSSGNESAGGGAGNPGGNGASGAKKKPNDYVGSNGTGGLLVIYANNLENNSKIEAKGMNGGGGWTGGGSSGGGSVNVFYKNIYKNEGIIDVDGGGAVGDTPGGAGGTGSISVGTIGNGNYDSTYTNY